MRCRAGVKVEGTNHMRLAELAGHRRSGVQRRGARCRSSSRRGHRVQPVVDEPPSWLAAAGTEGAGLERRIQARGKAWARPATCLAKGCSPRPMVA